MAGPRQATLPASINATTLASSSTSAFGRRCARVHSQRGRRQLVPPRHRLHRPLSTASPRPYRTDRRQLGSTCRLGPRRKSARNRQLEFFRGADSRSFGQGPCVDAGFRQRSKRIQLGGAQYRGRDAERDRRPKAGIATVLPAGERAAQWEVRKRAGRSRPGQGWRARTSSSETASSTSGISRSSAALPNLRARVVGRSSSFRFPASRQARGHVDHRRGDDQPANSRQRGG